MSLTSSGVLDRLRTPEALKLFRYSTASAVAVVVSLVCLVFFNGILGWSAWVSSTLATAIATVPSYEMNRKWAWGKSGSSHLWKEVVPFWALSFLGWALSTLSVHFAEAYALHRGYTHVHRTVLVAVVYIGAFGLLWVGKFVIFNKVLFAHHAHHAGGELAEP